MRVTAARQKRRALAAADTGIPVYATRRRRSTDDWEPQVEAWSPPWSDVAQQVSATQEENITAERPAEIVPARSSHLGEHLALVGICFGIPVLAFIIVVSVIHHTRIYANAEALRQLDDFPASESISRPLAVTERLCSERDLSGAVESPIPRTSLPRIPKPLFNPGFLQRWIFGGDMNPMFAKGADLSLRAGLVAAGLAVCFWAPRLHWLTEQGWSMTYAMTVFAFTIFHDLGSTTQFCWNTLVGTIPPVANCFFMFALYPDGVNEEQASCKQCFALVDFCILSVFYVYLNWPPLARMFAMFLQAYFTMSFLNPSNTLHFAHRLHDISMQDGMIGPLVGTIIGCTLSILASLIPRPRSALGEAQDLAVELAWSMGNLWEEMVKYYCSTDASLEAEVLVREGSKLRGRIERMEACVQTSWWECFDLGRPGQVREHLVHLGRTFGRLQDWLHGAIAAGRAESFDAAHVGFMLALKPELERLSCCAWIVLSLCSRVAACNKIDSVEEARIRDAIRGLEQAQTTLATAFNKAMNGIHGSASQPFHLAPSAIRENFFFFAVDSYGRCVSEYATCFLKHCSCDSNAARYHEEESVSSEEGAAEAAKAGTQDAQRRPLSCNSPRFWQRSAAGTSLLQGLESGVRKWTDREVLFTLSHARESARILLAFMLAFYIGRVGIHGVMRDFSYTPAGVTVFLLAFDGLGGSSFVKKFTRFQGVCMGTLLGQIIYSSLVRCSLGGSAAGFIVVLVFEFFAFYFYFTSEHFWYTGLLIATFGAQQMLKGCADFSDSPWEVYQALLDQVVAILCVIVADILLAPPSPSRLAVKALAEANELMRQAASELLSSDETSFIPVSRELILSKLICAEARGKEATLEPRFARTPWRDQLWEVLVHHSFKLAQKLVLMEYIVAEIASSERSGRDEEGVESTSGVRRSAIVRLLGFPAVQQAAEEFQQFHDQIMALGQELMLHEIESPLVPEHRCDMQWLVHRSAIIDIGHIVRQLDYPSIDEEAECHTAPRPVPSCPDMGTENDKEAAAGMQQRETWPGEGAEMAIASTTSGDANAAGAFLHMLELSTHDLNAIAESIVKVPEVSVSAIVCAATKAPKEAGLLRTLSGKLDVAIEKSKESVQDLWSKLNADANESSKSLRKDSKSIPSLPRSRSQPNIRVIPPSPTAGRMSRNFSRTSLG
jgi:hypothetical protein